MRNNFFKIALSLVLVLGLMPGLAFAEPSSGIQSKTHPGEGSLTTSSAQEHSVKANSGKWGECDWEYDTTTKTLTVHPGQAGEAEDFPWSFDKPVEGYHIVFKEENGQKVVFPEICASLFEKYHSANLLTIDFSGVDTSKVTNMNSMFFNCDKLTSINVNYFDTSQVTTMDGMFEKCESLTSLDVSNFDTSKVTDFNCMFSECSSLTSLDVSKFVTSSAEEMESMFYMCSALTSLDVSNFNTALVESMEMMFCGCSLVPFLDVSKFETPLVTNIMGMFAACSSLTSLDLSSFNTSQVEDMTGLFTQSTGLKSIDLSSFYTTDETATDAMFAGCSSLERVALGENIRKLDTLPSEDINGHTDWFSRYGTHQWISSDEIADNRLGIADLYLKHEPKLISTLDISNINDAYYTGMPIAQNPVLKDGDYTLKDGYDYNLTYGDTTDVGTGTFYITGLGDYDETVEKTFTISPKTLSQVTATLSQTEFTYDGNVHVPTITSISDPNLVEGTDYDVKYSNASSKEPGTYSVWIEGKGNYAGASVKSNYTIISSQPPVPPTPEAPSVVVQPKRNIKVKAGSTKSITLSFKAMSSDGGALSYQWYKNSKPIKGATKPTYTISNPSNLAPGNYSFYFFASEVVNGVTVSVQSEVSTLSIQSPLTLMKMTSKGKNALVMKWNKATNADGYDIFFAQCNHGTTTSKWKLIKTINKASTTTYTKTKLKANSAYKSYVRPFKLVNGKKIYLAKSPQVHAYTNNGSKTYTNPKALSLNKTKVSIKNKNSFQLKSKVTLVNPKKKGIITGHAPIVRYVSSNASIAKVTKTGKITGVSKGTCTIYAFTQNGITKACKVVITSF